MNARMLSSGRFFRSLCVLMACVTATAPAASVIAQTNAAQQVARQRAERIAGGAQTAQSQPRQLPRTGGDQTLIADPTAGMIDTKYVSPTAVALVALRPAQIMTNPMAEMLPTEVASAAGLKYLGFDPADVAEVIAFVDQINPMGPPEYGIVVKFNKPFRGSSINPQLRAHTQTGDLAGRRYLQSQNPMLPSFHAVDSQTLIVAPDATLRRLVESAGQEQSGPIVDRVKSVPSGNDLYAAVDIESVRPLIMMGLAQAQANVPADYLQFLEAPNLIKAAELTFNISGHPIAFVVHANDEGSGQRLEALLLQASNKYQDQMRAQFAEQAASADPVEQAMAKYMERISGSWTEQFSPQRDGSTLTFFKSEPSKAGQQQMANIAIIGVLVALLLPAIQAAREAARRNVSINNMKQIMLAMLLHTDAQKSFPAHAIYSPDGKPLLSWRVQMLPYLEQQALYDQFKLDEPWDSEHNRALVARMPAIFQNPNLPDAAGKTNYLAVVGEPCVFNGTGTGTRLPDVKDGTANTIVLVEASPDEAVEWTKPDDLEYDANSPKAGLGGVRPTVWIAGFADGSVRPVAEQIDPNQLKGLFTRAGGEPVTADF
jgi:hypothetical protein